MKFKDKAQKFINSLLKQIIHEEICEACWETLFLLPDESGQNLACTNCGQKYKIESYFLDIEHCGILCKKECRKYIMIYDK